MTPRVHPPPRKTGSELYVVHAASPPGLSGAEAAYTGANPLEAPLDPRYGPQMIPEAADRDRLETRARRLKSYWITR